MLPSVARDLRYWRQTMSSLCSSSWSDGATGAGEA